MSEILPRDRMTIAERAHDARLRLKYRWWSLQNWLHGYQFRPVQRFRCCEHTTPHHYSWCHTQGRPA